MNVTEFDDAALRQRLDELHPIINAAGAPRDAVLEYQGLEDELYRRVDRDDGVIIACGWDPGPEDEEEDARHLDDDQGAPSEWGA